MTKFSKSQRLEIRVSAEELALWESAFRFEPEGRSAAIRRVVTEWAERKTGKSLRDVVVDTPDGAEV